MNRGTKVFPINIPEVPSDPGVRKNDVIVLIENAWELEGYK